MTPSAPHVPGPGRAPTGRDPRFGIAVPQTFHDPRRDVAALRAFLQRAEDAGLDSLWVQEQILGQDDSFEPLAMLAFAAACTRKIRLGSAAFITPIRSPVHLAKELATVDQLSGGRLTVGVALGDVPRLFPAFGVHPEQRLARFLEGLQVMARLWTEPRVTLEGQFWSLQDVAMEPKPVQKPHPPVWFGGRSPGALRRAATLGDGWIGAGGSSTASFVQNAKIVEEALARAGRPRDAFTIAKKVYLAVGASRNAAFERLREWFRRHWVGVADPDRLTTEVGVYGTPAEVAEELQVLVDAGAELVILNPVFDERQHLEVLLQEVLPLIQETSQHRSLVSAASGSQDA